jgi:hypothetical protein
LLTASQAGFKISQGKNYYSSDCCMINSQVFRRIGGRMKRCWYLNLKFLCKGSIKNGDSNATPTGIARDVSEMCVNLPVAKTIIPKIMERFLSDFNFTKGEDESSRMIGKFRPNWYLPRHLGGIGLDVSLSPFSWTITREQRRIASQFIADPRLKIFETEGVSMGSARVAGALANWRIVAGPYVPTKDEAQNGDEWLARFCYASRAAADLTNDSDLKGLYRLHRRLQRHQRFKAMSFDDLVLYWTVQLFAAGLPVCPPIGLIRRKRLRETVAADGSDGVFISNGPKRYSSWLELDAHFHPEFNNSVLTKTPRDYTAPPVLTFRIIPSSADSLRSETEVLRDEATRGEERSGKDEVRFDDDV